MKTTRFNLLLSYAGGLVFSLWLGYMVRFNFVVPPETEQSFLLVVVWVTCFKLLCLWRFGQLDVWPRFYSMLDFSKIFWLLLGSSCVVFCVSTQYGSDYAPPRGVVLADFSFSVLVLTAIRLAFRQIACARAAAQ